MAMNKIEHRMEIEWNDSNKSMGTRGLGENCT